MAILPIRAFPDPVLRQRCHPVTRIDDSVVRLAYDMMETMRAASGIGLAANQVGVLKRIVTLEVPGDMERILINPKKRASGGKREVEEGCLSFPGYTGLINRAVKVTAQYLDQHGARLQLTAEELLAQAIEHEIDHLNGILFIDHLKAHEDLFKTGTTPDDPHWHDVGYTVYVDEGAKVGKRDSESVEMLRSAAVLSEVTSETPLEDIRYDVEAAGKVDRGEIAGKIKRLRGDE